MSNSLCKSTNIKLYATVGTFALLGAEYLRPIHLAVCTSDMITSGIHHFLRSIIIIREQGKKATPKIWSGWTRRFELPTFGTTSRRSTY